MYPQKIFYNYKKMLDTEAIFINQTIYQFTNKFSGKASYRRDDKYCFTEINYAIQVMFIIKLIKDDG